MNTNTYYDFRCQIFRGLFAVYRAGNDANTALLLAFDHAFSPIPF